MRNSIIIFVLIALIGYATFGMGDEGHNLDKAAIQYADSTIKTTEKGLFSVEMNTLDKRLLVGLNTIDFKISDKQGKGLTGADITFTPWMPEMGHGVFTEPEIVEKGNGLYRIENVILVMGGSPI